MITPDKADDATLMRIYKEGLTHTLEAAVRAVYELGLHDGTAAATAHAKVPPPTPAAPLAGQSAAAKATTVTPTPVAPAAHLTPPAPPAKPTSTK